MLINSLPPSLASHLPLKHKSNFKKMLASEEEKWFMYCAVTALINTVLGRLLGSKPKRLHYCEAKAPYNKHLLSVTSTLIRLPINL